MKKKLKQALVIITMALMVIGSTVSVSAAGTNHYSYTSQSNALMTNTSWKKLAYSDNGFNCNVKITCMNNSSSSSSAISRSSVKMVGKNGKTVVWSETGAVSGAAGSPRTFWCGSDVYAIYVKTVSGTGLAWANQQ